MKQVQVFKKTLLSLAVVSAFCGYGTVTQAQPVKGGGTTVNPSPSTSIPTSSASAATPSLSKSTSTASTSSPAPTASTPVPSASASTPTPSTSTPGTPAAGQQQSKLFNPITFVQGTDKEIKEHLVLLQDKFNGLTGNDPQTKSIQYSSNALFAHMQQADNDVADLNKKLKSAETTAANPYDANQQLKTASVKKDEAKKVADLKDEVKKAEEYAKKTRQNLVAFAKANQKRLGLKDNFLLAATQGVAGNKPGVVLQEKNAEPAEKVDFAALRKTSEGVTADASKVGLDASSVQAQGEDPAKFQARVTESRKKLNSLSRDDFRKIFLVKDPKAQNGHVAPEVIRLKGYDLRVPELYEAFMDRVLNDVPELFDVSATAASADVVFTSGTVELDGFKISPQSPLPGAHFATPQGTKDTDPYGTYIVAEDSDVYQESIGKDKPVDTFVVENSKFHAEDGVYASKVSIKDAENVAGYTVDATTGKVTEGYLPIVAKPYEDTAVMGKPAANGIAPVVARKRTVASFQGLRVGW